MAAAQGVTQGSPAGAEGVGAKATVAAADKATVAAAEAEAAIQ